MPTRPNITSHATRGLALAALAGLASCIPSPAPSFDSESPNARLEAIAAASNASDETSLRRLVEQLDADDPAARLLAITALHKRTGETFGYLAGDPDWRRREANERWRAYLDPQSAPEPQPPTVAVGPGDPERTEDADDE